MAREGKGRYMAEFDDFAEERARDEANRRKLRTDTKPEWAVLLGFVQTLAQEGKGIEDKTFQWVSEPDAPRLELDCVSATFLLRQRNGLETFRVYFSRRPPGAGKIWADDESPLTPLAWTLQPKIEDDTIKWTVAEGFEDSKYFSSFEMAQKIGIILAKFHLAYRKHYENWSPA